mmetsp:Transcript_4191/g.9919  ORF Transcript_4191/g.9919 Transcript_4191/m.9919 type:complete len:229 (-) Transcript_4191:761-1447(-)
MYGQRTISSLGSTLSSMMRTSRRVIPSARPSFLRTLRRTCSLSSADPVPSYHDTVMTPRSICRAKTAAESMVPDDSCFSGIPRGDGANPTRSGPASDMVRPRCFGFLRKELRMDDRSPPRSVDSPPAEAEEEEEVLATCASSTRRNRMHLRPGGGGCDQPTRPLPDITPCCWSCCCWANPMPDADGTITPCCRDGVANGPPPVGGDGTDRPFSDAAAPSGTCRRCGVG